MICDYVNFTSESPGIPFLSKCPIENPARIIFDTNDWFIFVLVIGCLIGGVVWLIIIMIKAYQNKYVEQKDGE